MIPIDDQTITTGDTETLVPDTDSPHYLLGFRSSAVIEILLFLTAALLIDHWLLDSSRYWDASPHPFWLLVLLISFQYGVNEGLLASAGSAVALLAFNLPLPPLSPDIYRYWLDVCTQPLLWFIAAILFGELRSRQLRSYRQQKEELESVKQQNDTIANAYEEEKKLNENLEIQLAGQLSAVLNVYKTARAVGNMEPTQVLSKALDVVQLAMHPNKVSLFLLKNGSLELATQQGWDSDDHFPPMYTHSAPLFQEVIINQRTLCIANEQDIQTLGGDGLLAGPIKNPETHELFGMLKIESLNFIHLNLSSIKLFEILSDWVAALYQNAVLFSNAKTYSITSDSTQLMTPASFERMVDFLRALSERINLSIHIVIIKLYTSSIINNEKQEQRVGSLLHSIACDILRDTDLTFEYQIQGGHFVVILPGTDKTNAQEIGNRLLKQLEIELIDDQSPPRVSMKVRSLAHLETSPDQHDMIGIQE